MNGLKKIGIEIEGGWNPATRVLPWFKDDWSAAIPGFTREGNFLEKKFGRKTPEEWQNIFNALSAGEKKDMISMALAKGAVSGECASPAFTRVSKLLEWIKSAHPDGTSDACAIHIHTSYHTLTDYAKIMTPHFLDVVLKRAEAWGNKYVKSEKQDSASEAFWKRFGDKKNQYAHRGFAPVGSTSENGYSSKSLMMNYHQFNGRRTFEFRLFPSFQKYATTVRAVKLLLNIVREVLYVNPPPEEQFKFSLQILINRNSGIPIK